MYKKLLLSVLVAGAIQTASAQQLKMPAPSPTQTLKQDFALSAVEVSYSRPAMKGRKVFGDLVPYGKVWRTGANNATTITFGEDVMFGGKKVAAGKYGLLSIPGANEWTIILSKQLDVTSPAAYKEDQDVARVSVKPMSIPTPIENFLISFDDIKPNAMMLEMLWDKTYVGVPITADIDSKIMAQIDNMMNKDNRPYFNAAMYYMESGKDLNKALSWFDKAIEQNPSAFWVYHQKANCLAKMGRKQEAIATANKSIELAKAAKNDDYVALNEKLLATLK
jgi:hypothetical protein